jgi:energy-coupling factor transport system ATP-binding protein
VRAEVEFGVRHLGASSEEAHGRAKEALDAVGMADDVLRHPDDLSEARRKLLTIASVLAMRTPVVILDEPTTGLDARGRERLVGIVRDLHEAGRTVIGISHDVEFVAETFERVVLLDGGRVVLDGAPADIFAEAAWPTLRASGLEPPAAALLGARLGLGSTPTEHDLVAAAAAVQLAGIRATDERAGEGNEAL